MYGRIRKGRIMKRRILGVVLLLLALAGVATAEDTEGASDKLAGKAKIYSLLFDGEISANDARDFKGFSTTLDLSVYLEAGLTLEKPVKYRVSWTSGQKWLSYKKPNPDHLRRGNLFFDAGTYGGLDVSFKVAVPAGVQTGDKTFRVRVRAIYADTSRDACVKSSSIFYAHDGTMLHSEPGLCR